MAFSWGLGIRGKLAAVTAFIMLTGFFVLGSRYHDSKMMLEDELMVRVGAEMEWWAHRSLVHQIENVKRAAVTLASLPEASNLLTTSASDDFERLANDLLRTQKAVKRVVLVGLDGTEAIRLERKPHGEFVAAPPFKDWNGDAFFKEGLGLRPGLATSAGVGLIKSGDEESTPASLCVISPVASGAAVTGAAILEAEFDSMFEKTCPVAGYATIYLTNEKGNVFYARAAEDEPRGKDVPTDSVARELDPQLVSLIKVRDKAIYTDKKHLRGFSRIYFDQPNSARYLTIVYAIPEEVLFQGARRVQNVFLFTALLIFLVSLVAVSVLAGNMANPVFRLAKVADRVAKGDLSQDAGPTFRRDEIGWLYRSFNEMIAALRESKSREEEKKSRLLEAAGRAAVEMTCDLSVRAILSKLVHSVLSVVGAHCACLCLHGAQNEDGFFAAGGGTRKCGILEGKDGQGLAKVTSEKGTVVRIARDDFDTVNHAPPDKDVQALFGIPIFCEGRVIGALCIGTGQKEISEADEAAIKLLTAHTGVAISNTWLHEEVVALAKDLERRVEERTRELREINLELERANRLKSEFLATMSHELRTPLNTIIGFSDVLMSDLVPGIPENTKEYLKDIMESGELLLSLINDVLDLAKIEAGKEELVLEEVTVQDFIRGILVLFRERAANHKITVEINTSGVGEWVLDSRKFKQILFNLLSNAFKFTPDGGKVGVKASIEGDMLAVTVWDTGIGIRSEDMPRLFKPFEQLDSSLARRYPGTGLGLTMVKRLVELHGGTVSVKSPPGKGSSFRVCFPLLSSLQTGVDLKSAH